MRPYTQPDLNKSIETLRAEVKRDYEQMAKRFKLPKRLDFAHACEAVYAGGMGIRDASPYKTFRYELLQVSGSTPEGDSELQDTLEILTGVWNYFPHNDLDELSPIEKMRAEMIIPNTAGRETFSLDAKAYASEIDNGVLSFSDVVARNLLHHLRIIGLGNMEQQYLLNILSDPQQEPDVALLYLFNRLVSVAKTGKISATIDDIQPAVRALTWCENYTASKMPNGHWNSRMFQSIVEQAIEFNTSTVAQTKPGGQSDDETVLMIDPLRTWQVLSMIHDAVSEFSDKLNIDIGMEEATRHLVDWLALTDIHELLMREDLNLSALHFIGAARLIAITGDSKKLYKRLEKSLRKEIASQVEPAAFEREIKRIAVKALNATQDPIMLMPRPGQEPDNCLENLEKLAPGLKSRSKLADDESPIPSPFLS